MSNYCLLGYSFSWKLLVRIWASMGSQPTHSLWSVLLHWLFPALQRHWWTSMFFIQESRCFGSVSIYCKESKEKLFLSEQFWQMGSSNVYLPELGRKGALWDTPFQVMKISSFTWFLVHLAPKLTVDTRNITSFHSEGLESEPWYLSTLKKGLFLAFVWHFETALDFSQEQTSSVKSFCSIS